jgi:hypothetical protein
MAAVRMEGVGARPELLAGSLGFTRLLIYIDGEATSPDTSVDASAVNEAGTTVATGTGITATGPGVYDLEIPAAQIPSPELITITWTITHDSETYTFTTRAEVVRELLFTIGEARALDGGRLDSGVISDDEIEAFRWTFSRGAERYIGGAPLVASYRSITRDGTGGTDLPLPIRELREVLSAEIDGTSIDLTELEVYSGKLYRPGGWTAGRRNIELTLEAGFHPVHPELRRAGLLALEHLGIPTPMGGRSVIATDETGTYRLAVAGVRFPTGLPEADAILERYRLPGVA